MNWLTKLFPFLEKKPPIDPAMKYLIVGLGNMGAEYDGTRHNVGFEVVDLLAEQFEVKFEHETLGDLGNFKHKSRMFYLLKPSTYMNLSGKSVRYWMTKLKIKQENLLIVLDDLNIDFTAIRMRKKGKDGGHNGLKDITRVLGGNNYARLRIGVGDDFPKGRQVDYVLGKWNDKELDELHEILTNASKAVLEFGTIGIDRAMSNRNK